MGGGDRFEGVVGRTPGAHQTRATVYGGGYLQVCSFAARAVAVEVKATLLMPEHVQ